MELDVAALQELEATESLGAAAAARGCCALWSLVTCGGCTILCTNDTVL